LARDAVLFLLKSTEVSLEGGGIVALPRENPGDRGDAEAQIAQGSTR